MLFPCRSKTSVNLQILYARPPQPSARCLQGDRQAGKEQQPSLAGDSPNMAGAIRRMAEKSKEPSWDPSPPAPHTTHSLII